MRDLCARSHRPGEAVGWSKGAAVGVVCCLIKSSSSTQSETADY